MFWTMLMFFLWVMWFGLRRRCRETARARAQQEGFNAYVRQAAGGGQRSDIDELARLSELRDRGAVTDEEFRRAKDLVLSGHGPAQQPGSAPTASGA